jgi:hypothetical protein
MQPFKAGPASSRLRGDEIMPSAHDGEVSEPAYVNRMRNPAAGLAKARSRHASTEKFVVQQIMRKRLSAGGALEYRTLWKGYPAAEATWEPAESFAGCRGLLAAFELT